MNYFSFYKDGKALYYLSFIGILLSFSPLFAGNSKRHFKSIKQQYQIQGIVSDGSAPLPGVTVSIKDKSNSASISDFNGQYSLSAAPTDTLVVSFIGFKTAFIPVANRTKIDIVLKYDTTTLREVRVNAGYYTVKESERTGSIARITSKDIENQPVTNILATMQGRMAGVSVTQTTGIPGGGFDIKIRGQNSIRNDANAPLYIIDGVPYSSENVGHLQTSTLFPSPTNPLNGIDLNTIESIEVLKDADATSIYGSRGANGVVLISTKRSRQGKTKFTLNASTGAARVTRFPKLMNTQQYMAMRRQAYINDGITVYPQAAYDINGKWDQNRYTDWQEELLGGTAAITDLGATVSAGSEQTSFMASGNYHTESTVFIGDFLYSKAAARINMNHTSKDNRFLMQLSAGYTAQNNKQPSFDPSGDARILPPNAPALYNSDGSLNWADNTWQNPLRSLPAVFKSKSNDLIANTVLSYSLFKNLTIKSSFGYTSVNHLETRISPSTIYNPAFNVTTASSSLIVNNTTRNSWIIEPQINWGKEIGRGNLNLLFGATFQNQSSAQLVQSGSGFSSNSLIYNLAAAARPRILNDSENMYRYQAFFARANYNLKEKYILNLTGRRDGSSRFGPGNQFAFFGAAGAAWLFHKEAFLARLPWLSFGKLRASWGTTGSDQIGDYQFLNTYITSGTQYNGTAGIQPTSLYNPDFAWEVNKKLEVAIETGFLDDRIFFTSAWYKNRSSNQLVGIPMPATTGFNALQSNLMAEVENTGWEFTIRTVNLNKGRLTWISTLNLTAAENKLVRFPGLEGSTYRQRYRIGQPLNIKLLYDYKGVNPQTGLFQFTDVNNDGRISSPEDKQIIADFNPSFFGGLQNQLNFKNWSLDFLFQFVKQKNSTSPVGSSGQMYNQPQRLQYSWTQPGDIAPYQLYTSGSNSAAITAGSQYAESNASITDASFIRLKNIALSYQLPLLLQNTKCSIVIQGQNLLTFTPYKDGDPEFISSGFLPPLKTVTAGIQLTF